jgi:STE24 endopeptidase
VALQQQNLANPRPGWLYKVFRASHPPIGERVDFINEYWRGEPGRYADRIRP